MTRYLFNSLVTICFLFTSAHISFGKDVSTDYFPKLVIGISSGYYNSFVTNFEEENNKEPVFGVLGSIKLLSGGTKRAVYGVAQVYTFGTTSHGKELIKWREHFYNVGLRYSLLHTFMERHNAQIWFGIGLSILDASRTHVRYRTIYEINEENLIRKRRVPNNIVERWESENIYFEIGQLIPFENSNSPRFGISWNAKFDLGPARNLNIGSFSLNIGLHFTPLF